MAQADDKALQAAEDTDDAGHASPRDPSRALAAASADSAAGHKNMLQLILLRWIAVLGQVSTIALVYYAGFAPQIPWSHLVAVVFCLVLFNIASHLRWREQQRVSNNELFFALLVDVASLTAQLHFSGGITNPFAFLYLLQVILSAMLLRARYSWTIVAITAACLAWLAANSPPIRLPTTPGAPFPQLYIAGVLICFVLNATLLVYFISRINRNLRTRDRQVSELREHAVEEEHIVRMGLLASGAAHELGTPLATLSVILGDWKHMPELSSNPVLREEIGEMEAQLKRCKSIVSGILLSAGEARGESSAKTTIHTFLDKIVSEWQALRPIPVFEYDNRIRQDRRVVFDSALKQTIFNILDNAADASPSWVRLEASCEADMLKLVVKDLGPGFTEGMLAQLGKPYQSTKGRPGGGLGLFLAMNVSRKLGGTVTARNRTAGGALVQISIPLSSIVLEEAKTHAD